jgi:hypothetical protein
MKPIAQSCFGPEGAVMILTDGALNTIGARVVIGRGCRLLPRAEIDWVAASEATSVAWKLMEVLVRLAVIRVGALEFGCLILIHTRRGECGSIRLSGEILIRVERIEAGICVLSISHVVRADYDFAVDPDVESSVVQGLGC